MAYQTGNFAAGDTFAAVHAKLKAFASDQGWAVAGDFPALNLSKGTTNAVLNFATNSMVDDFAKSGGPLVDSRIESYLADTPGGSQAYPQSMTNYRAVSNDWTAPYSKFWLFSGGQNDPDYIYMVVQKANGNFCTWMCGRLDRKGVDYDGGDFINGVNWHWWFATNSGIPANGYDGSHQGSDAFTTESTFPGDIGNSFNLRLGTTLGDQLNPDANPKIRYIAQPPYNAPFPGALMPLVSRGGKPTRLEDYGTFAHRWLGHVYWLGPNPVNGITPLFELPVAIYNSYNEIGHYIYMGAYPGYRACSMIGRTEAEHVTFGSDEWLIFPVKRFQPYTPEPFAAKSVTSGPYGHAFKINN